MFITEYTLNKKDLKGPLVSCHNFALQIVRTLFLIFYVSLFSLTSLSRLFHSYRDEPIGRSTPVETPDTPASRTWLVSHVASAGLEPTPDTAVI